MPCNATSNSEFLHERDGEVFLDVGCGPIAMNRAIWRPHDKVVTQETADLLR
jgi:hypothetical protein